MEKIVKSSVIVVLFMISVFILNLMDDKKITSLTIENTVVNDSNKLTTISANSLNKTNILLNKNSITFKSNKSNVISNINKNDLNNLLKSKKSNWKIYNEKNETYNIKYSNNNIKLSDYTYKSLTIYDGYKYYTLDYENGIYEINYPNVSVNEMYFHTLTDAYNNYTDGEIILLNDISTKNIDIDKSITINGNNKNIYVDDYLFSLSNKNLKVTLNNVKVNAKYILKTKKNNKNKLVINNSKIMYSNISNNKVNLEKNNSNLLKQL